MLRFVQDWDGVSSAKRALQGVLAEKVVVVLDNVWDADIIKHFNDENVRKPRACISPVMIHATLPWLQG
jgi:hypothetical protein